MDGRGAELPLVALISIKRLILALLFPEVCICRLSFPQPQIKLTENIAMYLSSRYMVLLELKKSCWWCKS
jgi:hypothetical protein